MNRLRVEIMAVTIIIFMSALGQGQPSSYPAVMSVKVDGNRLVDGDGRHVILRGANAGMRSKLPPFYPFEPVPDFDTALDRYTSAFVDLGFNAVRLLIIYEAAEPVRGSYDQDYLMLYDRMIDSFGEKGVHVIVDSHQDIFSRRFCGDGFPDWAIAERYRDLPQHADCNLWEFNNFKYSVAGSWDRFWSNADGIQDSYVEFFAMLARRYKDHPAVIGFEPINEPMAGIRGTLAYPWWNENRLYRLYEKVGRAVHQVDPRFLVFADSCPLENLGSWSKKRERPDVDNLVFAPHYYDVGYVKFQLTTGRDRQVMKNGLTRHLALGRAWGVPVLVGEYGIEMQREDAPQYLDNLYSVFDELLLSSTIWEASMSETLWNGRDKCIFNPDGSLRPGTLALDRPYPRAVAGVIQAFSFDPGSGVFELEWEEDPDISRPTEVYLPARVYGSEPQISIEPAAEVKADRKAGGLFIIPLGREQARKLTVTP